MELLEPRAREERFRTVYGRTFPAVFRYVRRRLPAGSEGELDVTAEIFTVVWRRIDDVPEEPEDLLWIYGVARNCVARFHRDQGRRVRLQARVLAEPSRRADVEGAEDTYARVRDAVGRLPELDREAIRLVHWEGLSHEEVGAVLGLTPNAVELRVRRARERLRRDLGSLMVDPSDTGSLGRTCKARNGE